MEDYQKYRYKLETHLKYICESNKEYQNLYATWELNKKTYQSVLKTIIMNYPHYSLHDDSHSETIITNIEMLLGGNRIKRLSPTETWMILHCAYLHDFGMALLYNKTEEALQSDEFKEYIKEKETSYYDRDLVKAIEYINNLKYNLQNDDFEFIWPLKIRKYVTYIIADYFRSKHSSLTKEYISMLSDWDIDISHNDFIQERLIKLIGEISFLHTQDFDKVMELSYESNGYNSDYIHPRFIAEMIRIGDLLDLDNGRFSDYVGKVNGELPEISKIHKEKHKSTRHILVNPDKIEVIIDCSNEKVYREARSWIIWIDNEINNLTMNWTDIIPNDLTGYPPKFAKQEILLNGQADLNKVIDLRFDISQEKAFHIIEGSNIYEDKFTFIREFLQNALDASKIQLWRDLKDERYFNYCKESNVKIYELTPFDIKEEVFNNYKIEVIIQDRNEDEIEIIIRDRGIGISLENLKSMSNVGTSYNGNLELKREIEEMPSWLRPTGGFGVGLQSAFLVSDKFVAYTKTEGNGVIEITFESRRSNGYIQVRSSDKKIKRGTEFHIVAEKERNAKYTIGGYVDKYLNSIYDPMINNNLDIYKILDNISMNCYEGIFPISINGNGEIIGLERSDIMKLSRKGYIHEYDYMYKLSEDLSQIIIWDNKESACVTIDMSPVSENIPNTNIYFKGMYVKNFRPINTFCRITVDIYGMSTVGSLKMSRNEITLKCANEINKIINNCIRFYIEQLHEIIVENIDISNIKINKFAFITMGVKLINNFHASKYKFLFKNDNFQNLIALEKNNNKIVLKRKRFIEVIDYYPNVSYIDLYDFLNFEKRRKPLDTTWIENLLTEKLDILNDDMIFADEHVVSILKDFVVKKMKLIDKDENIILYSIDNSLNYIGVDVDLETKKYFINLLVPETQEAITKHIHGDRQRSCIPAIKEYEELAVYLGDISGVGVYKCMCNKIISPITRNDKENIRNYTSREAFIYSIVNRDDYMKLLKYTVDNRVSKKKILEKEIDEKYKNLIGEYYGVIMGEI